MKALLKNIWQAPAATMAAALVAGLTYIIGADIDLPKEAMVALGSLSAVLAAFSGPNKPNK
jgi:hypothetical protein